MCMERGSKGPREEGDSLRKSSMGFDVALFAFAWVWKRQGKG